MIVAIIVSIPREEIGKPNKVIINVSEIVPPPIGTAVTNKVARSATPTIVNKDTSLLKRLTKNIILKTLPIIEPSLWKLVPSGIVVSAISSLTPIFLAHSIFTGIQAAEDHVASEVIVAGIILFQ